MAPFARVAPPTDARCDARVADIDQDLSISHGAGYGVRQATTRRGRAAQSAPAGATKLQVGSKAVKRGLVRILFSWFGRLARRIRGRPHMLGRAPCADSEIAVVVARQAAENDLPGRSKSSIKRRSAASVHYSRAVPSPLRAAKGGVISWPRVSPRPLPRRLTWRRA